MPVFVYRAERMVDKATGEAMTSPDAPLALPATFGDLPGYASPIDGRWVEGRRARRYDLESNGCVDANGLRKGPRGLKNERFAKKHGAEHLLDR